MIENYQSYSTYSEIVSQPEILRELLDRWPSPPGELWSHDRIVLTGCGSSLFLAQCIAHSWRLRLDLACTAYPASELALRPEACFEEDRRTLVFGLSRTGETPETVRALQVAQDRQGYPIIPVTCYPDSPLARLSSRSILLPELQEESSIMTRAFTGILAAFLTWAGFSRESRKLPEVISKSMGRHASALEELAQRTFRQVIFLGSGPFLPIASESALKWTEMTGAPALGAQTYEFRHGMQRVLDDDTLVWLFASREDAPYLREVIQPFRDRCAEVMVVGSCLPESIVAEASRSINLTCKLAASEVEAAAVVHLAQLYAFFRAIQVGGRPDHPEGLSRVTSLTV